MVAISKTPEYILFVKNLEANNEEAIEKVHEDLYQKIVGTKKKYDALIVMKDELVRTLRTKFKEDVEIQDALNNIYGMFDDLSVKYAYLILTHKLKNLNIKDYKIYYIEVHHYEEQLENLEYELKELKEKYIQGGGRVTVKYKSTGEHAHILYNNRKLKRCIYTKTKGRRKYCKINNKYILLSKLKIINI
jgi:hypothetical protein